MALDELKQKRDAKVREHLLQYAPVWLLNEQFIPSDETIRFDVVFQHNLYGWVNRRYRYDGFNNVLYYNGQVIANDDLLSELLPTEPYLNAAVSDVTAGYGG